MSNNATSSSSSSQTLEAIRYERGNLQLLNQLLLPNTFEYERITTVKQTFDAIQQMKVRGAPAIAISAALGLAVVAHDLIVKDQCQSSPSEAADFLCRELDYLGQSRPTAVNLHHAIRHLKQFVRKEAEQQQQQQQQQEHQQSGGARRVLEAYIAEAEAMLQNDVADNENISSHGSNYIMNLVAAKKKGNNHPKVRVLTHCNTGALATTKYGTALGVIRFLHQKHQALERVYATETRPYNQGARLTAFECAYEKIPVTLIVDSAVSYLFASSTSGGGSGGIDAVVVGADRVCANGDTANKIGTYHIAVSAKHHGVPFFVAAPCTSIDLDLASGDLIEIEQRSATEVTHSAQTRERVVAEGVEVWNPGFDVTPAEFITGGIITECGVIEPNVVYYDETTTATSSSSSSSSRTTTTPFLDVAGFLKKHGKAQQQQQQQQQQIQQQKQQQQQQQRQ